MWIMVTCMDLKILDSLNVGEGNLDPKILDSLNVDYGNLDPKNIRQFKWRLW